MEFDHPEDEQATTGVCVPDDSPRCPRSTDKPKKEGVNCRPGQFGILAEALYCPILQQRTVNRQPPVRRPPAPASNSNRRVSAVGAAGSVGAAAGSASEAGAGSSSSIEFGGAVTSAQGTVVRYLPTVAGIFRELHSGLANGLPPFLNPFDQRPPQPPRVSRTN